MAIICTNPACKAKHYDNEMVCGNCNWDLPAKKERKTNDTYCLASDYTVTTKRLTDKFLETHSDDRGMVVLLKNFTEEVCYYKGYKGWKVIG